MTLNLNQLWKHLKLDSTLRCFQKQSTRLPPWYFAPSNFVKGAFWKDESVFFFKIQCFFITISIVSNFRIFLNFRRKTHKKGWKEFWEIIFWDAFWEKFATLSDFEKVEGFFLKKTNLFFQKNQRSNFSRILLFLSHSTTNCLLFGKRNFTIRNVNQLRFLVNAIGRYRVKTNASFERKNLLPNYKIGA